MSNVIKVKAKKELKIDGEIMWIKDKTYDMKRRRKLVVGLGNKNVMCITNEQGKDHIISDSWKYDKEEFFNDYFVVV